MKVKLKFRFINTSLILQNLTSVTKEHMRICHQSIRYSKNLRKEIRQHLEVFEVSSDVGDKGLKMGLMFVSIKQWCLKTSASKSTKLD